MFITDLKLGRSGEGVPYPFFENPKKYPDFLGEKP